MLAPVAIVMGVLVFYPLVRGIMLSFTDADRFSIGNKYIPSSYNYIGLRNYKDILSSSDFRRVAEFSVIWTFVVANAIALVILELRAHRHGWPSVIGPR